MRKIFKGHHLLLASYLVAPGILAPSTYAQTPQANVQVPRAANESTFELKVDTNSEVLKTTRREPQDGAIVVTKVSGNSLSLVAKAKTLPSRPDRIWVDLYLVNENKLSLLDLTMEVEGNTQNVNVDPFSDKAFEGPHALGGVSGLGVAHASFTVPVSADLATIRVTFSGTLHETSSSNSTPILVTKDGKDVWSLMADAHKLFVVDTATDLKTAEVNLPGSPASLAESADGKHIYVVSSDTNQFTVIDRASRSIVQTIVDPRLGRDIRNIVVSSDGRYAFVNGYVSDTVTRLVRLTSGLFAVDKQISVGRRPVGMSLSADGKTLYVAHFLPRGRPDDNETWVSVVATDPFAMHHEVIWRDLGNRKEAKCLEDKYSQPEGSVLFEGTATQLSGVFLPPAGDLGWIPGLRVGPTALWEVPAGKVLPGIAPSTFSPGFAFFLDARSLESAAVKYHPLVLDTPDAKLDFLRCAKFDYDAESPSGKFNAGRAEESLASDGAAIPTGTTGLTETGVSRFVAFTKGARRALLLSYTSDEIQVFDAVTQHPVAKTNVQLSGSNPIGLAITPDGKKAYVAYENSLFTSVLDLSEVSEPLKLPVATFVPFEYRQSARPNNSILTSSRIARFTKDVPENAPIREVGRITLLTRDPLEESVRRGKVLFNSSNPGKYPGLSRSKQAACAVCHPGGGHDGAVWATVEGERRTMSLHGGVGERGWLHQSGTHRDIGEFVRTVVPERLGGTGLSEPDYNSLANYIAFHIPKLQAPATDPQRVKRGAEIFAKSCAGCHQGAALSSGRMDPSDPLGGGLAAGPKLFDIGTSSESSNVLLPEFFTSKLPPPASTLYATVRGDRDLGAADPAQQLLGFRPRPDRSREEFRAPTLINVWDHSIFLHDGKLANLRETVQYINNAVGAGLTEEEIDDVLEYLRSL